MEAERETTKNVELFWQLFNEVIYRVSNRECTSFNPIVWCTDMADSNLARICKVSGEHAKNTIKSCEFHFKDQRNKKAKRLLYWQCSTVQKPVRHPNEVNDSLCLQFRKASSGLLHCWRHWSGIFENLDILVAREKGIYLSCLHSNKHAWNEPNWSSS